MKKKAILLLCCGLLFTGLVYSLRHSKRVIAAEPWTPAQLESPEDLASIIIDPKTKQPLIFCIGPGAVIKGSIDIGPARDTLNLAKFKQQLIHLSKDADIIIYCGCCPFEHCPNIRPAFALLNQMAFTRQKLLNIEHNVKIDWINKGYPVAP
jgi:thiosulfate/3-mercaptopyruvate sulfurtransferase